MTFQTIIHDCRLAKNFLSLLSFLILLFYTSTMQAQEYKIEKTVKPRYYQVTDQSFHFYKMKPFFEHDSMLEKRYKRAKRSIKTADILGYTSLGLMVTSTVLIVADNDTNGLNASAGDLYGLGGLIVSSLLGTSGAMTGLIGKSRKNRLISKYNKSINDIGQIDQRPVYRLGITSSGLAVGLSVHF